MRSISKAFLLECARRGLAVMMTGCCVYQQGAQAAGSTIPLPTGGAYVAGSGSIKSSGNAVTINQSTLRGIIDWNTFSIGQGGTVAFKNGTGATLNRVTGSQMSTILGSLLASGSVYLINPEGVLIGPGGRVNTGGDFVASTLQLSPDVFMQGSTPQLFQGAGNEVVTNLGSISSKGGNVYLIGTGVNNGGSITAANGTAGLGAGSRVLLSDGDQHVFVQSPGANVTNSGSIQAAQIELKAKGGNIYALAGNNNAVIAATGTATKDGKIWLVSDGGATIAAGTLSARNAAGTGGSIETSGANVDVTGAKIKTGANGNWLLDPNDLTIDSTLAGTIASTLNGGTNVTEQTTATGTGGSGDINVNGSISWLTNNLLTLSAYRNINVNTGVTISNSHNGSLTLYADNAATGIGTVSFNGTGTTNIAGSGKVSLYYYPGTYSTFTSYSAQIGAVSGHSAFMLIDSASDLQNATNSSANYAVNKDINLSGIPNFTPLNLLTGYIFDGQMHTISNLTENINGSGPIKAGLIGDNYGTVRNVILSGVSISAASTNSSVRAGGLVGFNEIGSSVINSMTSGAVTVNSTAGDAAGGLVGFDSYATVSGSSSTATVSLTTGGNTARAGAGGLIGANTGTVSSSFARGSVTLSGPGGTSNNYAGGLIGYMWGGSVANSYSTGAAVNHATGAGANLAGGLVGGFVSPYTSTNSYWDTQSSGVSTSAGSETGLATVALQSATLPTGLTSPTWVAVPGQYPVLSWQGTTLSGIVYNGTTPVAGATVTDLVNGTAVGTPATTTSTGAYSLFFPLGTLPANTGILAYLSGSTTGSTFTDGQGTNNFANTNIYAGQLSVLNSTHNAYSSLLTALTSAIGSSSDFYHTGYSVFNSRLSMQPNWNLNVATTGNFTYDASGVYNLNDINLSSTGNLTLGSGSSFSTSGNVTLTAGGAFTDSGFSGSPLIGATNHWLIYSQNPANDTLGAFATPNFWQYNAPAGTTPLYTPSGPGVHRGNGVLYALPESLNVSLTGTVSKTYNASNTATINPSTNFNYSGLLTGYTATSSATTATYNTKDVGTGKAVTLTNTPTFTITDANNAPVYGYNVTVQNTPSNIGVITAATLTATVNASNKVYDGTTAATGTVALNGVLGSDQVSASAASYAFNDKNAGTAKTVTSSSVALGGPSSGDYTLGTVTNGTANITAAPLTATVSANNKVYDGTTAATGSLTLSGVIGSDQVSANATAFAFNSKYAGTAKVVGFSGVTLSGSANGNYALVAIANGTANITAAPLTATVSANNKVYDGTTAATGSLSLSGVFGSDQVSGNATYAFNDKNAGTGKPVTTSGAILSGSASGNYTLASVSNGTANITPAQLTASVSANNKAYDGTTAATGSLTLSGVFGSDQVSANATSYAFNNKNAGTAKPVAASGASLSGTASGNYTLATVSNGTANITPAQLTAAVSADNKVYDGTTAATGSLTLNGVIGSDQVSANATYAFNDKNAGAGKPVTASATLSGSDRGNYTLASAPSGTANITAAPLTAIVSANNKVYDGTTVATGSLVLNGVIGSDQVASNATYAFNDKNVATGKPVTASGATLSGSDAGNYTLAAVSNGQADITVAQLTASVSANNKVYDGTTAATGSLTLNGVIGSDQVASNATSYAFNDKNAATGKLVTASGATLSGSDAANYTLASVSNGQADITPAQLTASYTANSKTYDATSNATGSMGALNGIIAGDQVALAGATLYQFSGANAGQNKAVSANNVSLSGTDASNYTLTLLQAGQANINPAPLNYVANSATKSFGADTPTLTGTVSGLQGSDSLASATSGTATFVTPSTASSVAGAYAVNGTGLTLTTGNYTLAQATGNATALSITPITISIGSFSRNSGTPNPTFTVNYSGAATPYLRSLLAGLQLVTNAPSTDTPGVYNITAVLPQNLANTITVQPGTLTINAVASGTVVPQPAPLPTAGTLPSSPVATATVLSQQAALQTAIPVLSQPAALQTTLPVAPPVLAQPSTNANIALPANAVNEFNITIMPATTGFTSVQALQPAGVLSHASYDETTSSPDGSGNGNKKTYTSGAH